MAEVASLLPNLALFTRALRRLGIDAGPRRTAEVARAWRRVDLSQPQQAKAAARTVLCCRREDIPLFDRTFDLFLQAARHQGPVLDFGELLQQAPATRTRPQSVVAVESLPGAKAADTAEARELEEPHLEPHFTYSRREVLRRKDFAELTPEEGQEVRQMLLRETFDPGRRRTRRQRFAPRGPVLDLRRTVRHSLAYGGEALRLAQRQRQEKPRPVVALCDISGSMEAYSRMLLQFLYALGRAGRHTRHPLEAFVFGTRLTRITRQLAQRSVDQALRDATASAQDWGGGTRIGEALNAFNQHWGRRVLSQGAVVLLISDGWDRGEPDLLKRQMQRLHRTCYRLIWLNPLIAQPGFEPLTRGLRAALPHVDDFRTVHNLESLGELAEVLGSPGRC